MILYNKLSCNCWSIHTVFSWLIHWFETAYMMVLYKRHEHKVSQTTSHTFYYTYSTPKWKSMHANSNHSTSACMHDTCRFAQKPRLTKYKTRRYGQQKICMYETLQAERTWLVARGGTVGIYDDNYKHSTDLLDRWPFIRVQRGHRTHSGTPAQALSSTAGGAGSRRYNCVLCCLSRPEHL